MIRSEIRAARPLSNRELPAVGFYRFPGRLSQAALGCTDVTCRPFLLRGAGGRRAR